MLQSMTGFAAAKGCAHGYSWSWDLRSVNSKGLDLRLRVPDWIDGLEAQLRAALGKSIGRGSVSLSLKVQRDEEDVALSVNTAQLNAVLNAMAEIEQAAMDKGLSLSPSRPSDLLTARGVLESGATQHDTTPLRTALVNELGGLLASFHEMRNAEGEKLHSVLLDQLTQVESLTKAAAVLAEQRKDEMAQNLRVNLDRVLQNSEGADAGRVAQELAMIAVKSDVTEEIDRLHAHVSAARDLIATQGPVGRKLDFLMQEFNREANTLCSKAQNVELTRVGLDLKAVIDQMREQVQNVE